MTGWNNHFAKWLEILVILQMTHFAMWIEHTYVFASEFNAQENEGLTSNLWIHSPALWASQTQL